MRGYLNAAVLSFAHTLGEFGVVLMVGGNIPGETRVISIDIYDKVESLNYTAAHQLSATLLVFAFLVLLAMFVINRRWRQVMSAERLIQFHYEVARSGFKLDVAADIPLHGITGVYGASGAGKTTLLRCLAGLEQPTVGSLDCGRQDRGRYRSVHGSARTGSRFRLSGTSIVQSSECQ